MNAHRGAPAQLSDADDKFKRLYKLIEEGVTETDDVLKDRLNVLTEAASRMLRGW